MTDPYSSLDLAASAARAFLADLPERRVFPDADSLARVTAFDPALTEQGVSPEQVVETLVALSHDGVNGTAGPRYFGYVTGGALPATVAANWLAGAWDQVASEHRLSPLADRLETVTGGWLLDVLGLPAGCSVNFVTGGTMGTFVGLAAARETVLGRMGWDVQKQGLIGAPPIRIVASDESHSTVYKGLGMLGLGRETAVRVPTDAQGRIRPDALPDLGPDTIVCIQAGNVNTGSIDPFAEIVPIAKAAGAWVHIDGAFGLLAAVSPDHAEAMKGYDLADSWAVDGHKWLNTPYDCGIAICRHPEAVHKAFSYSAAYLAADPRAARNLAPELSRRARSVEVYAALASLGRQGLRDLVARCCAHARRFADGLRGMGFEVLNDVTLNQCLAAIGTPDDVQAIFEHVQASGEAWFSTTTSKNRLCLRLSITSWATTTADVDRTLAAIARAKGAVMGNRP